MINTSVPVFYEGNVVVVILFCNIPYLMLAFFQESELERLSRAREAETKFIREQNDLEITKAKEMASIETQKFRDMVDSIGPDTIAAIATAGPEMQVTHSLSHAHTHAHINNIPSSLLIR